MSSERNDWQRAGRSRMSRRSLLRASGRAAGLPLVGCGDDDQAAVAQTIRSSWIDIDHPEYPA